MGCLMAVKCAVECRLKRSAICYVIGEGGAGCGALLQKPEMSCVNPYEGFRRLRETVFRKRFPEYNCFSPSYPCNEA